MCYIDILIKVVLELIDLKVKMVEYITKISRVWEEGFRAQTNSVLENQNSKPPSNILNTEICFSTLL